MSNTNSFMEDKRHESGLATWRELICDEMANHGDDWSNIVASTMTDAEADKLFDRTFGGIKGIPFTLWTHDRVYFPLRYEGSEWCGSAPRNPSDEALDHQGG